MSIPWFPPLLLLHSLFLQGESRFNGTYILQPPHSDSVPKAVASAVAGMNFVIRPIARRRLEHTNQPAKELRLALGTKGLDVQFDARTPIHTPIDGRGISWTREDGERFMVRSTLEASGLIQRFEAPDGAKTNRFELDSNQLFLKVHVTVESSKLPRPLRYTLVYRRQGS